MIPVDEEKVQQEIKFQLDHQVKVCLQKSYHSGKLGYLTLVGGSALNHYLDGYESIKTSDYDLKFVVMPKFTDDPAHLRQANVRRLFLAKDLFDCLSTTKVIPTADVIIEPELIIRVQNIPIPIRMDGTKIYIKDPNTGEERLFVYKFNKIFTIRLKYQFLDKNKRLRFKNKSSNKSPSSTKNFSSSTKTSSSNIKFDPDVPVYYYDFVDIGMFYRLSDEEPAYNFMTKTMYDTMLKPPFNQRVPIPFQIVNQVRYPIIPYLLMDNFRMIHFQYDFFALYQEDEKKIRDTKEKVVGYKRKMNIILDYMQEKHGKTEINPLAKEIKKSFELYEPLAFLNAICYREDDKMFYTPTLQTNKKECNPQYVQQLNKFREQYQKVMTMISKLMPHYRPNKEVKSQFTDKHQTTKPSQSKKSQTTKPSTKKSQTKKSQTTKPSTKKSQTTKPSTKKSQTTKPSTKKSQTKTK